MTLDRDLAPVWPVDLRSALEAAIDAGFPLAVEEPEDDGRHRSRRNSLALSGATQSQAVAAVLSADWASHLAPAEAASAALGFFAKQGISPATESSLGEWLPEQMADRFAEDGLWDAFLSLASPRALLRAAAALPQVRRADFLRVSGEALANSLAGHNCTPWQRLIGWRLGVEWSALARSAAQSLASAASAPSDVAADNAAASALMSLRGPSRMAELVRCDLDAGLIALFGSVQEAAGLALRGAAFFHESTLRAQLSAHSHLSPSRMEFARPALAALRLPTQETEAQRAGEGRWSPMDNWKGVVSKAIPDFSPSIGSYAPREELFSARVLGSLIATTPALADALACSLSLSLSRAMNDDHFEGRSVTAERDINLFASASFVLGAARGLRSESLRALRVFALCFVPFCDPLFRHTPFRTLSRACFFGLDMGLQEADFDQMSDEQGFRALLAPLAEGVRFGSREREGLARLWARGLPQRSGPNGEGPIRGRAASAWLALAGLAPLALRDPTADELAKDPGQDDERDRAAEPTARDGEEEGESAPSDDLDGESEPAELLDSVRARLLRNLRHTVSKGDEFAAPVFDWAERLALAAGETELSTPQSSALIEQEASAFNPYFFRAAMSRFGGNADFSESNVITRLAQPRARSVAGSRTVTEILSALAQAGAPMRLTAKTAFAISPEIGALAEAVALSRATKPKASSAKSAKASALTPKAKIGGQHEGASSGEARANEADAPAPSGTSPSSSPSARSRRRL
jgi:hypothetical protein